MILLRNDIRTQQKASEESDVDFFGHFYFYLFIYLFIIYFSLFTGYMFDSTPFLTSVRSTILAYVWNTSAFVPFKSRTLTLGVRCYTLTGRPYE